MNETKANELIAAIRSLHPDDAREAWQFVEMRKLYHLRMLNPPTAAEWARLTEWQKVRLLWIVSRRRAIATGARLILNWGRDVLAR